MAWDGKQSIAIFTSKENLQHCRTELLPALLKLLKDLEAEVRIAAASKVPEFSQLLPLEQVDAQFTLLHHHSYEVQSLVELVRVRHWKNAVV